jgi:hypothetical protein
MDPTQTLVILVEGALMGLLGQGARAVAGLKSMSDDAKSLGVSSSDLFQAARLFVSLAIGFLVGLAAALIYLMNGGPTTQSPFDWHILLGFAAAGYAGTDFLEAFISKYLAPTAPKTAINSASITQLTVLPLDEPGQKEQAIMDSITAWLQNDHKLPQNQDVDPQGTMNGTYHFNGPPEVATFLQGVSVLLLPQHYNYDYTKDTSSLQTLTKLSTAAVTAVAYEIGKNTKYMLSGVTT